MATVTNEDIRRQFKNIVHSNIPTVNNTTSTNAADATSKMGDVQISTKQFKQLANACTTIICLDGTTATILNPTPFMKWHSIIPPNENGVITLSDAIEVTILTLDNKSYVLGFPSKVCGISKELEYYIDMGDTEIIINNDYYSNNAKHTVNDGVEQ